MQNPTINLLSPAKKKKVRELVTFLFIKNLLGATVFVCAVLGIALLWGWLTLVDEFGKLSQSALLVNREFSSYNQEMRKLNRIIKNVNGSGHGYYVIAPALREIAQALPGDIKLTSMELDRAGQTLFMAGIAQTRQAFLGWQETVKKIPWLERVEMPTSQLFQKENINFEIRAALKGFPLLPAEPLPPKRGESGNITE